MLRASLCTLGCKLNQFETAYIAHRIEEWGYRLVPFPSEADLYLINTCAVTAKSEHHSRNAVRKAIRSNPKGVIMVTGCAAQVNPEMFAAISGVDWVLGNQEKASMSSFKDVFKKRKKAGIKVTSWVNDRISLFPMTIQRFAGYTRTFIKVQEGCDAQCTYCIVPKARGPARSAMMEDIVCQVENLWAAGYHEIVLTGIHLGRYGKDLQSQKHLYELLKRLLPDRGLNRLRLSSIEPNEFDPPLLDLLGSASRLCPHFHVPLQSGSEKILQRMGRSYTPKEYKDVISSILCKNPLTSVGADIMVGFPGETEEDFMMTYHLVEHLPLAYIHVFSYSPRPCTSAAYFPDQVNGSVKKARSQHLRRLGQQKKAAFRSSFIGKELEGLVLNQSAPKSGYQVAITGNYIPVFIKAGEDLVNHMISVKVLKVTDDAVWGKLVSVLP
jgi:threonylcarbamoyladenosine tRNA methylthiotransferase MtaB